MPIKSEGLILSCVDHVGCLLSQGVQQLLLCTTNVQVGVRLGLINDEEPERADKALIYEPDNNSRRQSKWIGLQLLTEAWPAFLSV